MEPTSNITGADSVTISEALKRLGNQAPARQSFYSAVNKGKIREVTNKEDNPDGKRMVSWVSVCEYTASGGFKPRKKSTSTTEGKTETASLATGRVVPVIPIDGVETATGMPNPPPTESPLILSGTKGKGSSHGKPPSKPAHLQRPNHSDCKHKSAPQRERALSQVQMKPVGNEKPKVRNSPPLRVIKNGLRHLDFEQTKAIRDWADNRLLTVLRPASPLASTDSNNKNLQHA